MIKKLNAALGLASTDPTVRKRLAELGLAIVSPDQRTPEALRAFQKAEIERWWLLLREGGVKGD